MSGGYSPKVVRPDSYKIQTESDGFQKPFFMGASQVPVGLNLHPHSFSGSGLTYNSTDPTSKSNKIKLVLPR